MAVSIVSQPTTPNVTGTKLLFEVTSSNISLPQYSYLMDIYQSGSNDLISRVLQTPNPDGAAVFDPSSIIYPLVTTENILNIVVPTLATEQFKEFDFKFGEVYSTNVSSSITYYPNQTSGSIGVFNGTVNPNTGYNFPSQSYMPQFNPPFDEQGVRDAILTDAPYIFTTSSLDNYLPVGAQDRHTYSILKQAGYSIPPTSINPVNGKVLFSGQRVSELELNTTSSSVLSMAGYIDVAIPQVEQGVIHIPSGPQNLLSASTVTFTSTDAPFFFGLTVEQFFNSPDWLYYSVTVNYRIGNTISALTQAYINETLVNYYDFIQFSAFNTAARLSPVYFPTGEDKLVFAFANQYGALDYFNCYAPLRRSSTVERNIVSLPKVNYSNTVSNYSYERRGEEEYHREINDEYTITTPLLDQVVSNWLEQLLESPNVYVVKGESLVPIIITNSSYTSNTNENRQKVFTYDITFRPANGREIDPSVFNAIPNPPIPPGGECNFVPIITDFYDCG